MSDTGLRTEPTPAERARSILATAGSLTVVTADHRIEMIGMHAVDSSGRLTLTDPPADHLHSELAHAPAEGLQAEAEFTDIAPTPVRDRVRARLTLSGRLAHAPGRTGADGPGPLRFTATRAVLTEGGILTLIPAGALAPARPDPLAQDEAELLGHLGSAHTDTVAKLSRLLTPRLLLGTTAIHPIRLDRYGLVLRLEYARGHADARLPFAAPVRHSGQAAEHIRALVARAARAAHGCSLHSRRRPQP